MNLCGFSIVFFYGNWIVCVVGVLLMCDILWGMVWGESCFCWFCDLYCFGIGGLVNGLGNWSLVECVGNDKLCFVNFLFDRRVCYKWFVCGVNFLILFEVLGVV